MLKTETRGALEYLIGNYQATQTKTAPANRSRTGYGSKIPTTFMIIDPETRRHYRVYVMIYSNSGTCYIVSKGRRIILNELEMIDRVRGVK